MTSLVSRKRKATDKSTLLQSTRMRVLVPFISAAARRQENESESWSLPRQLVSHGLLRSQVKQSVQSRFPTAAADGPGAWTGLVAALFFTYDSI
jgi:hypothetical protein